MQRKHLRYLRLSLLGVVAAAPLPLFSQTSGGRSAPSNTDPGRVIGAARDSPDGMDSPEVQARIQNARKNDQRKHLVDNANRLVEATKQLRAELQTRPATADDERRLDEIARLARSVKDQMSGR